MAGNQGLLSRIILFFAILLASSNAQAVWLLDFEDLSKGDVVNNQFSSGMPNAGGVGVTVSAVNFGKDQDLAVIFNTGFPSGGDLDLAAPFSSPNFPALSNDFSPGNILILQENFDSCTPSVTPTNCSDPDDEGSRPAGKFIFDFTDPVVIQSVDFFDVETLENGLPENIKILLFGTGNVLLDTFFVPDTGGNNTWGQVDINTSGVLTMEVRMGGSGGIDNIAGYVVPEPSTMLLLGSGLAGLGFFRRRKKAA